MRIIEIMTLQDGVYICNGLEYTEIIASGATGTILYFPASVRQQIKSIGVTLIAGAGTGYIQFTTSPAAAITAGTATWQTWALGTKTGTESDLLEKATALRGISVSGEVTIEVLI